MKHSSLTDKITLIPYYPASETTLAWYQDKTLCKQVDNIDTVYDPDKLNRMYHFLNTHGDLFYIAYDGTLCGDVCLQNTGELSIVICKEYQNRHIGRAVIRGMLAIATEKGFAQCYAHIYLFNLQSRKLFEALGFVKEDEERYVYRLK